MDTMPSCRKLSGNALKIIACMSMLADHLGAVFALSAPLRFILRDVIGRMAFPLFCFLLVEGFFHTRSLSRYLLRLLLLAFLSEIPFDAALHGSTFNFSYQNVVFTLFLGLCLLALLEKIRQRKALDYRVGFFLQLLLTVSFAAAAWLIRCDYSLTGIVCIAVFYYLHRLSRPAVSVFWGCVILNLDAFGEPAAFLSVLPAALYNGKRGHWNLKYFFYLFYPVHLLLLLLLSRILLPA